MPAAALALARAGRSVLLVERGPFPGSKNMYGGVVYPRVLDTRAAALVGGGADPAMGDAPVDDGAHRHAGAHRRLPHRRRGAEPPYNGATAYRPDFDAWLAGKAEAAGAELVCSTTVTGLLRDGGRVVGVRTDRPDGDITAGVVIAVRRRQLVPGQGGRACTARSTRTTTPSA